MSHRDKVVRTSAMILGRKWLILDYGDAIPGRTDDPMMDNFGELISERNQCLAIHLAAGQLHDLGTSEGYPTRSQVMKASREIRLQQ